MKKLPLLFLIVCLIQGLTACGQHKYNPEAKKLNDSAVAIVMDPPRTYKKADSATMLALSRVSKYPPDSGKKDSLTYVIDRDSVLYEKAIGLLNKAIQIDSNYFIAYWNKSSFQNYLKLYNAAFVTAKQMLRLRPNDGTIHYLVGISCERTGDTLSAKKYYEEALILHEKELASIDTTYKYYSSIKSAEASDLFMLGQIKEAHDIWLKLYNKADERHKWQYENLWKWTRADFLQGSHSEGTIIYPPKK